LAGPRGTAGQLSASWISYLKQIGYINASRSNHALLFHRAWQPAEGKTRRRSSSRRRRQHRHRCQPRSCRRCRFRHLRCRRRFRRRRPAPPLPPSLPPPPPPIWLLPPPLLLSASPPGAAAAAVAAAASTATLPAAAAAAPFGVAARRRRCRRRCCRGRCRRYCRRRRLRGRRCFWRRLRRHQSLARPLQSQPGEAAAFPPPLPSPPTSSRPTSNGHGGRGANVNLAVFSAVPAAAAVGEHVLRAAQRRHGARRVDNGRNFVFCRRAVPLSAEKNDAAIVSSPGAMPSLGGVQRLGHDCRMNRSLAAGGGAEKHWS
jgi:hypothetical protein